MNRLTQRNFLRESGPEIYVSKILSHFPLNRFLYTEFRGILQVFVFVHRKPLVSFKNAVSAAIAPINPQRQQSVSNISLFLAIISPLETEIQERIMALIYQWPYKNTITTAQNAISNTPIYFLSFNFKLRVLPYRGKLPLPGCLIKIGKYPKYCTERITADNTVFQRKHTCQIRRKLSEIFKIENCPTEKY